MIFIYFHISMSDINLITVLGPTASGKTSFGVSLASLLNGEIISADSRQVYKNMDIGTGKDIKEYTIKGRNIPYHLIDILPPGYRYNLYEFQKDFYQKFSEVQSRGKCPILVGGTGMYIESVLKNYDLKNAQENYELRDSLRDKSQEELVEILRKSNPDLHNTTDLLNRDRTIRAIEIAVSHLRGENISQPTTNILPLIFGIKFDRGLQKKKISERLHARIDAGMIDEVSNLLESTSSSDLIYYGLEYKYITQFLLKELSYDDMVNRLEISIHQFAKKQMTWFRRMEKNGFKIHWIDGQLQRDKKLMIAMELIKNIAPNLNLTY